MNWDVGVKKKACSRCGVQFDCGLTEEDHCWCSHYPPIFEPDPEINCFCPKCFHIEVKKKIEIYVSEMTPEKALSDNRAKELPKTPLIKDIDYYTKTSTFVFTTWYHLKRGYCCKNGCRHCPYGFEKKNELI